MVMGREREVYSEDEVNHGSYIIEGRAREKIGATPWSGETGGQKKRQGA